MGFLYLLEKIRMRGLNELMLAVTKLGEETAFLIIAMVVFWCVDKKKGYYLLAVGFVGTIINQFLKLYFRIPRPWVRDPDFTILEQAKEAAAGYSFPSGHTQSAVGTFGALAVSTNKRGLRWFFVLLAALVGFSRMYIGVHTPADVLVSAGIACMLILALKNTALSGNEIQMKLLIGFMLLLSVGYLLFVSFWNFPDDVDAHNLESGTKSAYALLGALVGLALVYVSDKKWLNFPVKAVWWVQVIKVAVGMLLVLAVKEGLRAPLELVLPVYPARAVRYGLIVIMAGIIWPMSFAKLSLLGRKMEDTSELRND